MAGETYAKRYGAGFSDAGEATPVDSQFLNAVEAALLRLLGEDPAADELGIWMPVSNRFVYQKITNAQIDAAAAIDKSKLGALNIGNADVAAGAGIVKSKLAALAIVNADVDAAAAIVASKFAGYPADVEKVLRGDGSWGVADTTIYRKTAVKDVVNTVAETDLLNAEITLAANVLGANGYALIYLTGDYLNNSGATTTMRLRVKFGATTIWDSGVSLSFAANANRKGWTAVMLLSNAGLTNSQLLQGEFMGPEGGATYTPATTGWGGLSDRKMSAGFGGVNAADTTIANALVFSVIHGNAHANISMRLQNATIIVNKRA